MMREGNIISFKVFVDSKGVLMTEYSELPYKQLNKLFEGGDINVLNKIMKKLSPQFKNLHSELEKELAYFT